MKTEIKNVELENIVEEINQLQTDTVLIIADHHVWSLYSKDILLEKIENKLARGLVEHVATNMLSDTAGNVKDFMISDEKIRSKALADAKMAIESRAKETRWYELDKNKVKPQGEKKWYQE